MSEYATEPGLISVNQALAKLLNSAQCLSSEILPLRQALNRYLASDIFSTIRLPLFDQSKVDGYAICYNDEIKTNQTFNCVGEIPAGQQTSLVLQPGQAVRIFKAARIPIGTSKVVRQENVHILDEHQISIHPEKIQSTNIRYAGEEIETGECLARQGQQLNVSVITALSMAGLNTVEVIKYPKIAILITGNEVLTAASDFTQGKIFDANAAMLKAWFMTQQQQIDILYIEDEKEVLKHKIKSLSNNYDVIFTTGDIAVGQCNCIRPICFELDFEEIFCKVNQKPGKRLFFAKYQRRGKKACYLMSMAGNPVAVYMAMQIYGKTLLNALQGYKAVPEWFTGKILHSLKADRHERFVRMSAHFKDGHLQLSAFDMVDTHILPKLAQENCLVRIPAGLEICAEDNLQGIFIS